MSAEGLLLFKPSPLSRDTLSPDWDVNEGKSSERTVGRIYCDISAG